MVPWYEKQNGAGTHLQHGLSVSEVKVIQKKSINAFYLISKKKQKNILGAPIDSVINMSTYSTGKTVTLEYYSIYWLNKNMLCSW